MAILLLAVVGVRVDGLELPFVLSSAAALSCVQGELCSTGLHGHDTICMRQPCDKGPWLCSLRRL